MKSRSGVWVVIPASGVGSRMQSEIPKQYLLVHGKTILEHTIECFMDIEAVIGVVIVISEADTYWNEIQACLTKRCQSQGLTLLVAIGGKDRYDSVYNGLSLLRAEHKLGAEEWVMVHDAARPCVKHSDLLNLLKTCEIPSAGGAILATPVRDTLKQGCQESQSILRTQSRENIWQAQTPQLFRLGTLLTALEEARAAGITITDEASAIEYAGYSVRIVEGSSDNIKLTTPPDLNIITYLLDSA